VLDTGPRSVKIKEKNIYLVHLSDTCRTSVIGVSDTATHVILEGSVLHRLVTCAPISCEYGDKREGMGSGEGILKYH